WDGRSMGVPPYGHNHAYQVLANTPIETSTARRFDALIRLAAPFSGTVKCEFINNRGQNVPNAFGPGINEEVVITALIPLNIGGAPVAPPGFNVTGSVFDQIGAPAAGVSVIISSLTLGGAPTQT